MTIVVKLGGTNGSGKSSVARALLGGMAHMTEDIRNAGNFKGRLVGYRGLLGGRKWKIIGGYRTVCGGMDTISDKLDRLDLLREAITGNHYDVVFFEGLITGKTYGAIGAISEEPKQRGKWIYAFMDTPFDVCVDRVLGRRMARALAKVATGRAANPFNPERTMRPTYKSVQAVAKRAAAQGHAVLWLPHHLPAENIARQLTAYVEGFHGL